MKVIKLLSIALFIISNASMADFGCPKEKGYPFEFDYTNSTSVYFDEGDTACYFSEHDNIIRRVTDTTSAPRISIFDGKSKKIIFDSKHLIAKEALIDYGFPNELLDDFIGRKQQYQEIYKFHDYGYPFTLVIIDNKYVVHHGTFNPPATGVYSIKERTKDKLSLIHEYSFQDGHVIFRSEDSAEEFKVVDDGIISENDNSRIQSDRAMMPIDKHPGKDTEDLFYRKVLPDDVLHINPTLMPLVALEEKIIKHLSLFQGKTSAYPKEWIKRSVVHNGKKISNRQRFTWMLNKYRDYHIDDCKGRCEAISFSNDLEDYLRMEWIYKSDLK